MTAGLLDFLLRCDLPLPGTGWINCTKRNQSSTKNGTGIITPNRRD